MCFAGAGVIALIGGVTWALFAQSRIRVLVGHERPGHVQCLAFSPSGELLASGGLDRTLNLWSVPSGERLRRHVIFEAVTGVAFSPDERVVAAGFYGNAVEVYDVRSGDLMGKDQIASSATILDNVAFISSTEYLTEGISELRAWSLDGRTFRSLRRPEWSFSVRTFAVSPDRGLIASCSFFGDCCCCSAKDGGVIVPERRLDAIRIAFAPDSASFAVATSDGSVVIVPLPDATKARTLFHGKGASAARALAFTAEGSSLLVGLSSGEVRTISIEDGHTQGSLKLPHAVDAVASSPRGDFYAAATAEGLVYLVPAHRPLRLPVPVK